MIVEADLGDGMQVEMNEGRRYGGLWKGGEGMSVHAIGQVKWNGYCWKWIGCRITDSEEMSSCVLR